MIKRTSRKGQGLAEYGMILVVLSLMAITMSDSVSQWVVGMYGGTASQVEQVSQRVAPDAPVEPPPVVD